MTPSLSEELGSLIAGTAMSDIGLAARERARVSLLHNLAMALSGRQRERVAHVAAACAWLHPGEATLWATGQRVSREGAAFANAALMHVRSQDDTHAGSTSHPGSPVMAVAIALAEALGSTGADCLAAIVLGYEAIGRIGYGVDKAVAARGFRAAGVFGIFGAAAAASRLMGLSPQKTAHALGFAAQMAGGLSQVWEEGSAEYPLQLGFAARNGLSAAIAADAGATAAREVFEGRFGLFRAYGSDNAQPSPPKDRPWAISEATVKAYPVCAVLQGPVESLLRLCGREIAPDAIRAVTLSLSPFEATFPGIDNRGPFPSAISTKMSAQFSLALAAVEGRVTSEGLANVNDPRVLDVAGRVDVIADPRLEPRLSRLVVTLADGSVRQDVISTPVGRPSFDQAGRFAAAMAGEMGLDNAAVDRLVSAIAALDTAPDVHGLVACLVGTA